MFSKTKDNVLKLLYLHSVAFCSIFLYLFWSKNKKRAVFCVYKPHLNLHILLFFSYLEVARGISRTFGKRFDCQPDCACPATVPRPGVL